MNRSLGALTAIFFLGLSSPAPVATRPADVTGMLVRSSPSLIHTVKPAPGGAAAGYQVYLRAVASTDWLGPVLTDALGRFAFYGISPGQYQLRIYDGPVHVWDQVIQVPADLPIIVASPVTVIYYAKSPDSDRVTVALHDAGYPYQPGVATNDCPTDELRFGKRVAQSDVQQLAKALARNGVVVTTIEPLAYGSGAYSKVIAVGARIPCH